MATKQTQVAGAEVEYPLPAGYEQESVGFARAYAHAKANGNQDKAALLYAEAWQHDFEEADPA